jgi:RHS repeat-associated protein
MHMLSTLPGEAVSAPLVPWSAEEIFSLAAENHVNDRKPHQGVTGKNPGLYPGATACNSTTALGVNWRQWSATVPGATVTYDYDAFGNEFTVSGGSSTPNEMYYRGEQWDSDLGLYYLRARYYNPITGRFMSRDPEDGIPSDPSTLHKYNYAGGDPVDWADPTGRAEAKAGTAGGAAGEWIGLAGAAVAVSIGVAKNPGAVQAFGHTLACDVELIGSDFESLVKWGIDTGQGLNASIEEVDECHVKEQKTCTMGGATGTVVIGEEMNRVAAYAKAHGAGYYQPPSAPPYLWLNNNMEWITAVMNQKCKIEDGGPMQGRSNYPSPTSAYYFQEKALIGLRGYPTQPVFIPPMAVE